MENAPHTAWDTIDDLENRSRRNNLRLVGVPESITPPDLNSLCAVVIPKVLGMDKTCGVERTHRVGPSAPERKNPRQIIVKYLNYGDKNFSCEK